MDPETQATKTAIARLRREMASDRAAMEDRGKEACDLLHEWGDPAPERTKLIVASVALHGWYTALEALLERAVRELDQGVPQGAASRRALLSQAMTEIDGLRPAIVPETLQSELTALLGFRQFFRHAYAVELEPAKLVIELRRLERVEPDVRAALETFDVFLAAAAAALDDPPPT